MKILSPGEQRKAWQKGRYNGGGDKGSNKALLEAQHEDTLRQVRELLDGMKNPYNYWDKAFLSHDEIISNKQRVAFEECRQRILFTIKALPEEKVDEGNSSIPT